VDEAARVALYRDFQRLVVEDLPLINVAEWGFTTVASDQLHNIQNTPRWAVSSWPDTWIEQ
jgi:peptide/nickel transport system substrate-binding protein